MTNLIRPQYAAWLAELKATIRTARLKAGLAVNRELVLLYWRIGKEILEHEVEDAALSAFAVFFSQSPSFLDCQVRMQKQLGRNNASSLVGVHEIPCDNQIRNLLDPVRPETLYPVMAEMGDALYQQGYLAGFRSINDTLLIALDRTDFFSSEKISCACCSETRLSLEARTEAE